MKNNNLISITLVSTLSILLVAVTSLTIPVYAQEDGNTTDSANLNKTFKIDDLIYEGKGEITGTRVLNAEEGKVENTAISIGIFNGINATEMETFWAIPVGNNVYQGGGQAIITTTAGGETASFQGYGMGYLDDSGTMKIRGVNFYKTSSQELSFLDNMVGLFEYEVDQSENTHKKVWEWK